MAINLTYNEAEAHHPASPWKYNIVRRVVEESGDPDVHVAEWLQNGAPAGLSVDIEPGGLFPAVAPDEVLPLETLEALDKVSANHPSFGQTFGEKVAPGVGIVQGYVEAGFGELFMDQAAAEQALGSPMFPAPLGNVTKTKPTAP